MADGISHGRAPERRCAMRRGGTITTALMRAPTRVLLAPARAALVGLSAIRLISRRTPRSHTSRADGDHNGAEDNQADDQEKQDADESNAAARGGRRRSARVFRASLIGPIEDGADAARVIAALEERDAGLFDFLVIGDRNAGARPKMDARAAMIRIDSHDHKVRRVYASTYGSIEIRRGRILDGHEDERVEWQPRALRKERVLRGSRELVRCVVDPHRPRVEW